MDVTELRPGLWRWTARHPEWRPGDDWNADVGCVYYEAPACTVLIDPLVPQEDEGRFWQALDRDVKRRGQPVTVVLTASWHERSAVAMSERYGAMVWAPALGGTQIERGAAATAELPLGVEQAPLEGSEAGEVAFFLPEAGALVAGDIFTGSDAGLDVIASAARGDADLLASLERIAALGADLVLPSHGEPVLSGGQAALLGALARFTSRGRR
jgi:glyoxylase-like metal-dependent hydrolase (beta-lactamase superfamily II)